MDAVQIINLIIDAFLGIIAVPFTSFIKNKLGWSEGGALLLAYGVAGLLAVVQLLITGQITGESVLTLDAVVYSLGLVFSVATGIYKKLEYNKLAKG